MVQGALKHKQIVVQVLVALARSVVRKSAGLALRAPYPRTSFAAPTGAGQPNQQRVLHQPSLLIT